MYHVGRPGEDGYANRVLQAWGVDGHNSHTNVCSSSARLGHFLWTGADRPSPDYANAQTILLLSSHLETGPLLQSARAADHRSASPTAATLICIDPRLSNTSAKADLWLPAYSGHRRRAAARDRADPPRRGLYNREFVRNWVNWRDYLDAERPDLPQTFEAFIGALKEMYAQFTPEYAEAETGVRGGPDRRGGRGDRPRRHARSRRTAGAPRRPGNLWGWQITRCLYLLVVLTGALGEVGGVNLHVTNKFVPKHPNPPPPPDYWNELLFPKEFPLAFFEMSFLLPHFLKEGRGKLDVYFTRVYNPLWTNPDGFSWMEVLQDEDKIGMHVALTPIWSETAWFADYILPMGLGTERHDTMSQETHAGRWLGFRQPVLRVAREKRGEKVNATHEANPGEVWEEAEFWIALSWKIDPDGSLGIRKFFESPYRPGEKITIDEYYGWIFENSVPGLPEAAAKENLTPLQYMRKYGVFKVSDKTLQQGARAAAPTTDATPDVVVDGVRRAGFNTPSRKLEFYSPTLAEWGWPEHAMPALRAGARATGATSIAPRDEFDLLPNFRLPTLIHTRSPVKWLYEISHNNPLWISTEDARPRASRPAISSRSRRSIGYFVTRAWVTEGIRPGVVGMSHHLGRWRLNEDTGGARVATVAGEDQPRERRPLRDAAGSRRAAVREQRSRQQPHLVERNRRAPEPHVPGAARSGQRHALLASARPPREGRARTTRYGDIVVDTNKAHEALQGVDGEDASGAGPDGSRRPLWFDRPLRPYRRLQSCADVEPSPALKGCAKRRSSSRQP